jgi:hypothetical protein
VVSLAATAFELRKWGEGVGAPFSPYPLSSSDPSRARVHTTRGGRWHSRRVRDLAMVLLPSNLLAKEE